MRWITRFVRETEGQDLIEYAMLAALIALATTGALTLLGTAISTELTNVNTGLTNAS